MGKTLYWVTWGTQKCPRFVSLQRPYSLELVALKQEHVALISHQYILVTPFISRLFQILKSAECWGKPRTLPRNYEPG
jgi:hypothetical protein